MKAIAELRERAKSLRQGRWSDGPDDALMMEHAADTIWELRNKLAGVVDQRERIAELEDENAKLRELVYDMLVDEERGHNDELTFDEHVERASELGVELYA